MYEKSGSGYVKYASDEEAKKKAGLKKDPQYYFMREGDFDIVWPNVGIFVVGHLLYFYSCYVLVNEKLWYTWFWTMTGGYWVGISTGCGSHRLWAHRSYEASLPLKIFLIIGQSLAGQNSVYIWCRDHRVHHKFSDTDGDPHNTGRGYFFSHVGWLLRKKHPEMKRKAKTLDFSDLLRDPVVKFQHDHYWIIYLLMAFFLPMTVPVYFWNETWWNSFLLTYVARYMITLHCTWFVNSTAHMFGARPYNIDCKAVENALVSACTFGEGYHNYHHSFPWDYRASELAYSFNVSKMFIETMARLGLAYNLKTPSKEIIEKSKENTRRLVKESMCGA